MNDKENNDDVLKIRLPLDDTVKHYYLCGIFGETDKIFIMPMTDKEKHVIDSFVEYSSKPILAGNFFPYITVLFNQSFNSYEEAVEYYLDNSDCFKEEN